MRWPVLRAYLTWDRGHLARHAGGTPAVRLSTGIALCALVLSLALAAAARGVPRSHRRTSPTPIRGPILVSDIFLYRGGELHAEDVPVSRIAAAVRTPFYLYSTAGLTALYRRFAEALTPETPLICYAVKANSNLAVLRHFARLGAGADVVSEGELRRALAAGVPPERIIFSGSARRPSRWRLRLLPTFIRSMSNRCRSCAF